MIRKTTDTALDETWSSERGELTIRRPTQRVVLFVEKGHLEAGFAPLIVAEYDRALSRGSKPYIFVDCHDLETYDLQIRHQASRWILKNRRSIVVQHMLARSLFAKMGLRVVSLLLGGVIVGHHERRTFEQALREAIAKTTPGSGSASAA